MWQDALQLNAAQSRDQVAKVWPLRTGRLHLLPHYDNGLSDGLGSELSAPYFPLPNWQNLDWALSQINLDQSFTGSVIYDLPFGHGKQFGSSWNDATNAILGNFQLTLIERIFFRFPRATGRQH